MCGTLWRGRTRNDTSNIGERLHVGMARRASVPPRARDARAEANQLQAALRRDHPGRGRSGAARCRLCWAAADLPAELRAGRMRASASYSGFVGTDTSSVVRGLTCGAQDGSGHPVSSSTPAGSYTITCRGASATNYSISYQAGTLTITPAPLTITADNKQMTVHGSVPALTASYSGFVNGETAAALTTAPSCRTTATSSSPVGSYPITCSGAVAPNYSLSYKPGTLSVVYRFDGFLQPINDTAHTLTCGSPCPMSIFKAGSTVPVKFQLKDASGAVMQAWRPGSRSRHAMARSCWSARRGGTTPRSWHG
jgi:MBG domain (YGX type)